MSREAGAPRPCRSTVAASRKIRSPVTRGCLGRSRSGCALPSLRPTAGAADPDTVACLTKALGTVRTNLTKLMTGLRAAAGPSTQIVGITYPDVLLGNALSSNAKIKQLAQLSVVAFKSLINPTLQAVYTGAGAKFVDVTAATGAYGSLTTTTTLAPYGKIPVPVAKICQLTYYCQFQDIHPRTNGYAIIAGLVVGTLPKR